MKNMDIKYPFVFNKNEVKKITKKEVLMYMI